MRKIIAMIIIVCASGVYADDYPLSAQENQAVVLMYHQFGHAAQPSTNVRLEQFEAHLEHLEKQGYEVWPLQQVVDHVARQQPFPTRVVAITIDDAYQSVYSEAYPRLKKRGWPFTVFVATDGIDANYRAYMDWDQMREMQQHGVTFANHSASHDYLIRRLTDETDEQWRSRVTADIARAQQRLKQELGTAPDIFAYPYGEYNVALAKIVADFNFAAFGQQSGPVGLGVDLRSLPRFPMAERFAGIKSFRQKVASLAFPIDKVEPWSPVWLSDSSPEMIVQLIELKDPQQKIRINELNCFFSGKGKVAINRTTEKQFSVKAFSALPKGRSRYNCTAPSAQKGRYYWYSHLWIRPY